MVEDYRSDLALSLPKRRHQKKEKILYVFANNDHESNSKNLVKVPKAFYNLTSEKIVIENLPIYVSLLQVELTSEL